MKRLEVPLSLKSLYSKLKRVFLAWVYPPLCLDQQWLNGILLYIADVGYTGEPHLRWRPLMSNLHFYFFDPHPEAVLPSSQWTRDVFPIGLWSEKAEKQFSLLKNPDASSLFEIDQELRAFDNWPLHKKIGDIAISLNRLDDVLTDFHAPDFLKLDAEGADFEILKGADSFLTDSILGIQVETSMNQRHIDSPLFGTIDSYLRNKGYKLFDMNIQRWQRVNRLKSSFSKSQVIWSDCVYIISLSTIIQKLRVLNSENREVMLKKYFIILMVYSFHDAAEEFRLTLLDYGLINEEMANQMKLQIVSTLRQDKYRHIKLLMVLTMTTILAICTWPFMKWNQKFVSQRKRVLDAIATSL